MIWTLPKASVSRFVDYSVAFGLPPAFYHKIKPAQQEGDERSKEHLACTVQRDGHCIFYRFISYGRNHQYDHRYRGKLPACGIVFKRGADEYRYSNGNEQLNKP